VNADADPDAIVGSIKVSSLPTFPTVLYHVSPVFVRHAVQIGRKFSDRVYADADAERRGAVWKHDLIPASIYDKYSVCPSVRPICTRCCLTMTNKIQVCSNFQNDYVGIDRMYPDADAEGRGAVWKHDCVDCL
jgi:hypothetical protein